MIKILHCADIHLDSAFALEIASKAEVRRSELRGTFTSLIYYAKTNAVDIVLIAGDLFDREFVTKDTISLILREFASVPSCRFVIAPGNHDPYNEGGVYAKVKFPDNVYIFKKSEIDYFDFEDINTRVYGYAFTEPSMTVSPFAGVEVADNRCRINLLCAHGDTASAVSQYCPISKSDIRGSGVDYIALGHIHNSEGISREGDTYYGYSGCLEGRDFGECGYKGAIYAELEKNGTELKADFKGLRFSKRRYESISVDISGCCDLGDAASRLRSAIAGKFGEDTSLRVELTGNVSAELASTGALSEMLSDMLFYLEISDSTLPLYDYEKLKKDPTLKGAFFRCMLPRLENGTAKERAVAARALRCGLAALEGRDIGNI